MLVRKALAAVVTAALLASCSTTSDELPPPDGTGAVGLSQNTAHQVMPLATTAAGTGDPHVILPLVTALNTAWKPLVMGLNTQPNSSVRWGIAGVGLMTADDKLEAHCQPGSPFDLTLAHGVYCLAPVTTGGGAVQPAYGNILFPDEHFRNEITIAQGDKKLGVSVLMAYFYTLHIRQVLQASSLVSAHWGEDSRTQWCLTGVSLRALGVFTPPSPLPSSAATPYDLLPMGLTHVFSGVDVDERHAVWVLEGFQSGAVKSCFK